MLNQGAKDAGFADTGALWKAGYDMSPEDFEKLIGVAWEQILPLYEQVSPFMRTPFTILASLLRQK